MVLSKIFKVVSLASPTPKRKDGGGGPLFSSERTPVDLHVNQILNFIINSIQKTKKTGRLESTGSKSTVTAVKRGFLILTWIRNESNHG